MGALPPANGRVSREGLKPEQRHLPQRIRYALFCK
jgi:hypothetical protein